MMGGDGREFIFFQEFISGCYLCPPWSGGHHGVVGGALCRKTSYNSGIQVTGTSRVIVFFSKFRFSFPPLPVECPYPLLKDYIGEDTATMHGIPAGSMQSYQDHSSMMDKRFLSDLVNYSTGVQGKKQQ